MSNDIQAIKARAEAATPGPWDWDDVEDIPLANGMPGPKWLEVGTEPGDFLICELSHKQKANAEFIAHARTDVPYLLTIIASQEAEIGKLRAAASHQFSCHIDGCSNLVETVPMCLEHLKEQLALLHPQAGQESSEVGK